VFKFLKYRDAEFEKDHLFLQRSAFKKKKKKNTRKGFAFCCLSTTIESLFVITLSKPTSDRPNFYFDFSPCMI
jgi:hypothetical protein